MRIVLRQIKTGLYLQKPGEWTRELRKAQTFRHSAEAMDLAREYGWQGLEVLLAFEEPLGYEAVALPLP